LERALEGSFACVVLDVMLPGRDGFSVVAELAARRFNSGFYCSLEGRARSACAVSRAERTITSRSRSIYRAACARACLIRRAELRHKDATLKVGDVTLDPLWRVCSRTSARRSVAREFALLEFLMRNAGRTCRVRASRRRMELQIRPRTNVVDVYVNFTQEAELWRTHCADQNVRGVGYRLEADTVSERPQSGVDAALQPRGVGRARRLRAGSRAAIRAAAEMALRRSLDHSADVIQSLLGAYVTRRARRGRHASALAISRGMVAKSSSRAHDNTGGMPQVYTCSGMPAKRLEGLRPMRRLSRSCALVERSRRSTLALSVCIGSW